MYETNMLLKQKRLSLALANQISNHSVSQSVSQSEQRVDIHI